MGFKKYQGQAVDRGTLKLSGSLVLRDDVNLDEEVLLLVKAKVTDQKYGRDANEALTTTVFAKAEVIDFVPTDMAAAATSALAAKAAEDPETGTPGLPLDE